MRLTKMEKLMEYHYSITGPSVLLSADFILWLVYSEVTCLDVWDPLNTQLNKICIKGLVLFEYRIPT